MLYVHFASISQQDWTVSTEKQKSPHLTRQFQSLVVGEKAADRQIEPEIDSILLSSKLEIARKSEELVILRGESNSQKSFVLS